MITLLQHALVLVVVTVGTVFGAVIPSWIRMGQPGESTAAAVPPSLLQMADAERAFSRLASDATPRDAFIEFFADESVSFQPDPGPARERLRKQPPPPAGRPAFTWEPRTGDVAASGDLGYLTGPVKYPQPDGSVRHGCYFSVWKRQPDGNYRVVLDIGIQPPGEVPFAPGFVRAPARAAGKPAPSRAQAEQSLLEADKAFSAAIARDGATPAFGAVMHPAGRLHRNGALPMTSREQAVQWLGANVKAMTSEPMKSETGSSGDLGYTWGRVSFTGADGKPVNGYYVRLWTLGADNQWQLAADITPA
jgi:ketosteroid isomerase-like protein